MSLLLAMTVICGLAYPFAIAGIAQLVFPAKAEGSLILIDGKLVGSRLIGQHFADPKYFWGRPSATAPQPYNAIGSTGSNFGPLNPALIDQVKANIKRLRDADPDNRQPVPIDLVTASASGLDPEIGSAAANYQVARVARLRGLSVGEVRELVAAHSRGRVLGFIGEPRVNVLELNLALDTRR